MSMTLKTPTYIGEQGSITSIAKQRFNDMHLSAVDYSENTGFSTY
jgi:hypothetical protein